MTVDPEKPVDESASEFMSEDEVHRLVAANLGRDRWRAVLREAEADGFPKIDALFRGRSRSKIKRWLDSYNEVANHEVVSEAQDGQENFNAAPKRQARVQARPPRAAVLDRQTGEAGSDGVSGSVHRFAARR